MDALKDGSPVRAGRGVDAARAAMLAGPVVPLPESSYREARLELLRSPRTMVQKELMRGAGRLLGSLVW